MKLATLAAMVSLALPCSLASMTWSQEQVTPADRAPTLQEAIDAADPGDAVYADHYLPQINEFIRVNRPLTLVGGTYRSIAFSGPGGGHASLIGATVEPDYQYASPFASAGIYVSGFELVAVINSRVQATGYASYGQPQGAPALWAEAGTTLLLVGSEFRATIGGYIPEATCAAYYGGSPGVFTPGAVFAQGSSFFGGGGAANLWCEVNCPDGPQYTAPGAPGLIANRLWDRSCQFIGGPGAWWLNHPSVGDSGGWYTSSKELKDRVLVR
ncbi:MAG TPA: hypothetical protein VF530_21600 [Planctomycetota bacterium]